MLGGSLTRYHTPTLHGEGFLRDLVKIAGPSLIHSLGHGLETYEKGASATEALKSSGEALKRGLKRKAATAAKNKVKQSYKKKRQQVKDILGV